MIELTTGVMFLMSSLYGNVATATDAKAIVVNAQASTTLTTTIDMSSSTATYDRKAMEAFLRKEYADVPILVDIARCESEFRQFDKNGDLIRGRVNSADIGVMQINEKYHDETAKKLGLNLHTVEGNVGYAKHLYAEQGAQPWMASSPCWAKVVAKR